MTQNDPNASNKTAPHKKARQPPKTKTKTKTIQDPHGGTNDVIRGRSHAQLLQKRSSLRRSLASSTEQQRHDVSRHLHGPRADLAHARLKHLKQDDRLDGDRHGGRRTDDSKEATYRRLNFQKRKAKPNKHLERQMARRETKRLEHAMAASDAQEILRAHTAGLVEAEHDMEKTVQLTQQTLKRDFLEEVNARNVYDLDLDATNGPYKVSYDRSGRYSLLAGRGKQGHVAVVDQHSLALQTEFYANEPIRDACFLHDGSMMALAQERKVFVYDQDGVEIHRLDKHSRVFGMQFLPYHWLLATIGHSGMLQYQDTSTGELVSQHRSKLGPCHVIRQNPFNSVIHLGHTNGTVTLWSPSSSEYLVKLLCHRGNPITSLAIDRDGRYMATGGGDSKIKIWDLRTYKELHSYSTYGGAPSSLDISQTGILGAGHGCHATFWKPEALSRKLHEPYMKHMLPGKGPVESLRFRPFEDVCGLGHVRGISSIVVPGSGEPNLDSTEHFTNPYADNRQRREAEVRSLLEKLNPDMIALDPDVIGSVEESNSIQRRQRLRDLAEEANARREAEKEAEKNKKEKKRMRGRSKIAKKLQRKQKNIVDENVTKLRELREKEKAEKERSRRMAGGEGGGDEDEAPAALKRFF
ncbi:hypothetical protein ACHAXS_013208 [Conticribra weissflogii]